MKKYNNNSQLATAAWANETAAEELSKGDFHSLSHTMGGGLKETIGEYIQKITQQPFQTSQISNNVGTVNINVTQPNASLGDIYKAAVSGVTDAMNINTMSGVTR